MGLRSSPSNEPDTPFAPPKDGRCIINELPTELLAHIFFHGFHLEEEDEEDAETAKSKPILDDGWIPKDDGDSDFEDVDSDGGTSSAYDPDWEFLITQVCKRWREVAIEIPHLWSVLTFTEESHLDKAEVYLERSKGAPLTLTIDYTDDHAEQLWNRAESESLKPRMQGLTNRFLRILELVRPHLSHVLTLEVMVTLWKYMSMTLEFLGGCPGAPLLQVLELYHYDENDPEDSIQYSTIPDEDRKHDFILFHGNTPLLREVTLWGVHVDWENSTFLRNLSSLELAYHEAELCPSFKDFARILQESPDLKMLTISESGPRGGPVEWLESITEGKEDTTESSSSVSTQLDLPSVREFVLAHVDPGYATELMERLSFPNLTALTLDLVNDEFTHFISGLTKPHRATNKSIFADLTTLHLGGVGECKKSVVYEVVAVAQKVTSLRLNFNYLSKDWYRVLIPGHPSLPRNLGTAMPHLKTFFSLGLVGEELTELVKARSAAGVPLSRLLVSRTDDMSEEEEEWMKKESGLTEFDFFDDSDDEDMSDGIIEMDLEIEDDDEDFYDWQDEEDDDDEEVEDEDEDEDEYDDHQDVTWLDID